MLRFSAIAYAAQLAVMLMTSVLGGKPVQWDIIMGFMIATVVATAVLVIEVWCFGWIRRRWGLASLGIWLAGLSLLVPITAILTKHRGWTIIGPSLTFPLTPYILTYANVLILIGKWIPTGSLIFGLIVTSITSAFYYGLGVVADRLILHRAE